MSQYQEQIVRDFLRGNVLFWRTLPYDWMEMDIERIDEMCLLPIPDEVEAAYNATRNCPEDRERHEDDYDHVMSEEELCEYFECIKRARIIRDGVPKPASHLSMLDG